MRKTKIICTLGPSTDQEGVLRELVANGMNVARFNFSHGSHEEHLGRFEKLKAIREELGKPVAALLDTKGSRQLFQLARERQQHQRGEYIENGVASGNSQRAHGVVQKLEVEQNIAAIKQE